MKELLSFAFLVLFIACQNPSHSNSVVETEPEKSGFAVSAAAEISSATSSESAAIKPFDWIQEMENPGNPGIHYRPEVLASTPSTKGNGNLICVSRLTEDVEFLDSYPRLALLWGHAREKNSDLAQDPSVTN